MSARSGFSIDDEDLGDLTPCATRSTTSSHRFGATADRSGRIVMAARGGGAVDPALDARLQLALGWTFADHDLLDRALTHRSYCAEHGVEESNERLEFLGDSVLGFVVTRYVYERVPRAARGRAGEAARRGRERRGAGRRRAGARPRCVAAAGQGRGRVGWARQAVDPRRRHGGGHRRGVPRRRARAAARLVLAAARAPHPRAGDRPGRAGLQDAAPGARGPAVRPAAPLPGAPRGPRPLEAVLRRRCRSAARSTARARDVRRRRPSRPRHALRGNGCRARRAAPPPTGGTVSGWGMPELPEVEVVRRDLEREVVGKKIKAVDVDGMRSVRRHHNRKQFTARLVDRKITAVERRGKYLLAAARRRRRARHPPRDVGAAPAGQELARDDGQAHARRDHVHAGRPAALRRPAHVRRDVRHRVRHRREGGHRARAPRDRPARDGDVVGALRVDAGRSATPS